jgi:hypothetical protein
VAMVALATGAVAAAGGSVHPADTAPPVVLSDATDSASASGSAVAAASCDPTLDQIEDAAEKSAKAALPSGATMAPEGSEPPHCNVADIDPTGKPVKSPKAVASCDPTLDQIEDAAEKAAKASNKVPEEAAGQSEEPKVTEAPEANEPPHCDGSPKGGDKDPGKGDQHKAVGRSGIGDHGRGGHDSGPKGR